MGNPPVQYGDETKNKKREKDKPTLERHHSEFTNVAHTDKKKKRKLNVKLVTVENGNEARKMKSTLTKSIQKERKKKEKEMTMADNLLLRQRKN